MKKLDKEISVALHCPQCGNTHFESASGIEDISELRTCISCGNKMTNDELIAANQENIQININELSKEMTKHVQEHLKQTLKTALAGNKNIKIK